MTTTYVFQWLKPDEVRRRLADLHAEQGPAAHFSGLSDPDFSLFLSGKRALSGEAQDRLSFTLNFFEDLQRMAGELPVNYRNIEALEKLFADYCRQRLPSEVARAAGEST
jgi:hypothetical protein